MTIDFDLFEVDPHTLAHTNDADTSQDAAQSVRRSAQVLRERIYALLNTQGAMHAEQVAEALDVTHLQAMKRLSDLKNLGLIEDSGGRAPTVTGRQQTIWQVKP